MASRNIDRRPGGRNHPAEPEAGDMVLSGKSLGPKPPRPSQCRNFTREAIAESLPGIVDAFVGEAKKGSVPHFNLLSKFGGFDQRPIPAPTKRRGKSVIHRLLDNMKEHEAKMIAASKCAAPGQPESKSDRRG